MTTDFERSGRPAEGIILEIKNNIHDLVKGDRKLKVPQIVTAVSNSSGRVHGFLYQHLKMGFTHI